MLKYIYEENLISDRIKTEFLTESDIPVWSNFFKDPNSAKFLPDYGISDPMKRAEHWITSQFKRYESERFGLQKIVDKQTGEFLGQCGLLCQEVDGQPELEVGYHFFKEFRDRGFATEAACLFIDFAFRNKLSENIISIIDVENFPSQRVAEKNGLRISKRTRYFDLDVFIYRIYQHEWA